MNLTAYQDDLRQIVKNRALAYDKTANEWKLDMALDDNRGGGGALLSTATDLLAWNEALSNSRLGAFVTDKLHEPAQLNNGRKLGYARGLYLNTNRGGKVIWHTGGSSGYGSILARFPAQYLSVAIMCNSGDVGDRTAFTRRIFDLFVPATNQQPGGDRADSNKATSAVPPADATKKAGLYLNEINGETMTLLAGPRGNLRVAKGPALTQISPDRFRNPAGALTFMSGDEFELHFISDDQFELTTMEGKKIKFRRARPYTPLPAELNAFTARYESDEIGTIFRISAKEKGLLLTLEHAPQKKLEFAPVDPDAFQAGGMIIRFRRDKSGTIIALDYTNPVLRNVRFERLANKTVSR